MTLHRSPRICNAKWFTRLATFVLVVGAFVASLANDASASPITIYTRWVGDSTSVPPNPNGAYFQYCDWNLLTTGKFECDANHGHDLLDVVPDLPDPIGGVSGYDFDGDGQVDWIALTGDNQGTLTMKSGYFRLQPGVSEVQVSPQPAATSHISRLGTTLGFGVGYADTDGSLDLIVARTTNGANFIVDVFNRAGGSGSQSIALNVPGMTTVALRDPSSDFLAFATGDYDHDGVADLMVLHRAAPGVDAAIVSVFRIDGTLVANVTLPQDPVARSRTTTNFPNTYVGGIAYTPIETGGAAEWAILTVDNDPNAAPRPQFPMRFQLWRYAGFGGASLGAPLLIEQTPLYGRAVVVGIAGLPQDDNNCNGIDDDHDGAKDEDFVKPTFSCGIGLCSNTASVSCSNGVLMAAPSCVPRTPNPEQLDGFDNDCNGVLDNIPELPTCAPGQTDWWCCPTGSLIFAVNAVSTPGGPVVDSLPDDDAAQGCLPTTVPMSATCNLRGAVRRAEQLRGILGTRPACQVTAQLAAGVHEVLRTASADSDLFFGGGDLTLVGMGANPAATTIKAVRVTGGDTNRILTVTSANHVDFAKFTLRNATMSGGIVPGASGGAILAGGIPLQANTAPTVSLTLDNAIIDGNASNQPGGGVAAFNTHVEIRDTLFRGNHCDSFGTAGGGRTSRGGGLAAFDCDTTIERSAFVGNAASKGGGISVHSSEGRPASRFRLTNSTVSSNYCGELGCGMEIFNADASIQYSTIADNRMVTHDQTDIRLAAGIVGFWDLPNQGRLNVVGSIIAGNKVPGNFGNFTNPDTHEQDGISPDCHIVLDPGTTLLSTSNNVIGSGGEDCELLGHPASSALVGYTHGRGGVTIDANDPPVDPKLAPLPEMDGCGFNDDFNCRKVCPTQSSVASCFASPQVMSPALAQGPAATCPADDQRRYLRPSGQVCTLGAYESNGLLDTDHDGIADIVDPTPAGFSIIFNDDGSFGQTRGSIVDTAGHQVVIEDALGLQNGVTIRVVTDSVSSAPAVISVCGTTTINVSPGETVTYTCPAPHSPFFASSGGVVGNDAVFGGSLFGSSLNLGTGTQVTGGLKSTGNIALGLGSAISGNATLHGILTGYRSGIGGTLSENATVAPELAVLHTGSSNVSGALVVHNTASGVDQTLSPGNYGDVTIDSGATLAFAQSGLYRFRSLNVGDDATLVGVTDGNTTAIAIDGAVTIGDRFTAAASDGGADGLNFLIYTNGTVAQIGHDVFLAGTIEAPHAPLTIGNNAFVMGRVAADALSVGHHATIDTDDSDPCASSPLQPVAAVSSSNESSTFNAAKAIDGNASTRWSSAFADPQWIYVDLGANRFVNRVVLTWEAAFSSNYSIQIAQSASGPWVPLRSNLFGRVGTTSINGLGAVGRYVRMYSQARATPYGNSLFEFKVYGDANTTCAGPAPLPAVAAVSSANESAAFAAGNAIDGSFSTRWSSAFSDSQWIYVDLGAPRTVNRVRLNWEVAYSSKYDIRVSNDATNWTTVYTDNAGNGGVDDIGGLNVTARYVKMQGRARATAYGHSLWELRVYGAP